MFRVKFLNIFSLLSPIPGSKSTSHCLGGEKGLFNLTALRSSITEGSLGRNARLESRSRNRRAEDMLTGFLSLLYYRP